MGFLGLVDSDEETTVSEAPARTAVARPSRERTGVTVLGSHTSATQPAMIEEPATYNIITLQPRSYSEARKVGEYYREGNPVIINLDDMEESERKRLVDFASGLVFGLHGVFYGFLFVKATKLNYGFIYCRSDFSCLRTESGLGVRRSFF